MAWRATAKLSLPGLPPPPMATPRWPTPPLNRRAQPGGIPQARPRRNRRRLPQQPCRNRRRLSHPPRRNRRRLPNHPVEPGPDVEGGVRADAASHVASPYGRGVARLAEGGEVAGEVAGEATGEATGAGEDTSAAPAMGERAGRARSC